MRKRDLFIDTQFDQFQSTDFKEHHSNLHNKTPQISKNIFNEHLLEQYYQGAIGLMELIHTNHIRNLAHVFNVFKQIPKARIQYSQSQQSSCLWDKYLRKNNRKTQETKIKKSISTDRFKLLNELTDKYLKKERIKSQQKGTRSFISNVEGKKILSKLDKLQRMIKDIKRQNKMSNQASVVYSRSKPYQNIPVKFIHPYQYHSYHNPYQIQRSNILYSPNFIPQYMQSIPIRYQTYPETYYPKQSQPIYQAIYQQYDQPIIIQNHHSQRYNNSHFPANYSTQQFKQDHTKYRMKTDQVEQIYQQSMQSKDREDIGKQLHDIKQQLKQLKLTNRQYLYANTINDNAQQRQFEYNNKIKIQRVKTETETIDKDKYIHNMIQQKQSNSFKKKDQYIEDSLFPDEQFQKSLRLRTEKSQINRPFYGQYFKQRDAQRLDYQSPGEQIRQEQFRRNIPQKHDAYRQ